MGAICETDESHLKESELAGKLTRYRKVKLWRKLVLDIDPAVPKKHSPAQGIIMAIQTDVQSPPL